MERTLSEVSRAMEIPIGGNVATSAPLRELQEALGCLSAEASKIRFDADEQEFERLCDAVHCACAGGDAPVAALDRHNIVSAIADLVNFVERM